MVDPVLRHPGTRGRLPGALAVRGKIGPAGCAAGPVCNGPGLVAAPPLLYIPGIPVPSAENSGSDGGPCPRPAEFGGDGLALLFNDRSPKLTEK